MVLIKRIDVNDQQNYYERISSPMLQQEFIDNNDV